jgi:hypothetical protein
MIEQPWSVIEGSAMASSGAMLLGWGRARYATLVLPLMYGQPAQQRAAADVYATLSAALAKHPDTVDTAVRNVDWTAPSAELYKGTVVGYADDAADKAASPKASADILNNTAGVYDVLGKAVFLTGAAILTAGVVHKIAQTNPFTRVASEVAATGFGRRADHQAATIASRGRAFVEGGKGVLAKALQRLMAASPVKRALVGGAAAVTGGVMGQSAAADHFSGTKLEGTAPLQTQTQPQMPRTT